VFGSLYIYITADVATESDSETTRPGQRTPVVVTIGRDLKLKVWRDSKLLETLTLPRVKARFTLGLPYLVAANAQLDRFFYTDDAGLHVVEC
jgi:hypothetical protein